MTKIKNIIFDLGGVLLRLNYQNIPDTFSKYGFKDFENIYGQARQIGLFNDFETGKIDAKSFREGIRNFNTQLQDNIIDECWNSILLDFPLAHLEFLRELKKEYRLFVLSNTNEIHLKAFTQIIEQSLGYQNYLDQFEQVYYSNEIGMRKPDKEAFQWVLKENKLEAEKTLFVDDTEKNLIEAAELGIRTALYPQNKELSITLTGILAELNQNS